jgi:hypothetical protein
MNTEERVLTVADPNSPAAVQSAVEAVVEKLNEGNEPTIEVETLPEDDAATLQAIEAEIEADSAKEAAYASQESDGDTTIVPEENAGKKGGRKKNAAPKEPKEPRQTFDTVSAAVAHKIGGRENLALYASDAVAQPDVAEALRSDRYARFDAAAKKVGEKIVNLFAASAGKAKLSEFTQTALRCIAGGSTTSKAIYEAMIADGYSVGTSRSQSQQMMHLLPLTGIAKREKDTLTLESESVLFTALAGKF